MLQTPGFITTKNPQHKPKVVQTLLSSNCSIAEQLLFAILVCCSRGTTFYPPYVILPLGIFPYSKSYFKDRVKASL